MENNNKDPGTGSGRDPGAPGRDSDDLTRNYPKISNKVWTAYKRIAQKYSKVLSRLASHDSGHDTDSIDRPLS